MNLRIAAIAIGLALSGCTSSALMVERQATAYRAVGATLEYLPPTLAVKGDTEAYLQAKMNENLVAGPKAVFAPGADITIRYQLLGHKQGNRLARFITSGAAGGSKTFISAEFLNPAGEVIGKVRSEGSVQDDFFTGGSAKSGIDSAVHEIADYARTTFKQ